MEGRNKNHHLLKYCLRHLHHSCIQGATNWHLAIGNPRPRCESGGALWGNGCPSDDVKCCLVRFDGMVNTDFHAIKLPTSPLQLALQITMLACFLTEQQILYNTPRKINILNPTMQVFGSDEIPAISVAPPHLPSLQSCCLTNWPNCLSLPTRKDGACEPWNGIFWDLDRENYGLFKNLSVPK